MGQRQAEDPLKVIFNYNNVFYSFFYDDTSGCTHRSREFAMNYVYSGEMVVDNGHERIHVGKGECVFIPRDHHITLYKRTCDGERYCGIFLMFTRAFLKEMYDKFKHMSDERFSKADREKKDAVVGLLEIFEKLLQFLFLIAQLFQK